MWSFQAVLLLAAGFVAGAFALVRLPPLPWTRRKRPWPHDTRRIAHRGGSMIGPENTMLTFRRGLATGLVDMLELDVCLTSDGEVVVAHDASLQRNCGIARSIPATRFRELPRTARRIPLHFMAPSTDVYEAGDEEWAADGPQALPTLREVFEALPGVAMHVDAKYQSAELARKTVGLVREFRREDITIVGSARQGNADLIRGFSAADFPSPHDVVAPSAATAHPSAGPATPLASNGSADADRPLYTFACAEEVAKAVVLYYAGLLPLVPVSYDAFDIPLPTAHLRSAFGRPLLTWLLYTPKLWKHLQARGVRVYGFVVNCGDDLEEAREWPVDGVMTDDPRLFAKTPWLKPDGPADGPVVLP